MDDTVKAIAIAVLTRADQDLRLSNPKLQESARAFLTVHSEDLDFWCSVAGLRTADVLARYQQR